MRRSRCLLVVAAMFAVALSGCASDTAADSEPQPGSSVAPDAGAAPTSDNSGPEEEPDTGMITLPGTGRFAIGTDAPYGSYQLLGEPDTQPPGCTWSIVDADGQAQFENQGIYAFLTDVPENVTFITDGCPDWEKFE